MDVNSINGEEQGKRKRASAVEFPLHKVARKQLQEQQLTKLKAAKGSLSRLWGAHFGTSEPSTAPGDPSAAHHCLRNIKFHQDLENGYLSYWEPMMNVVKLSIIYLIITKQLLGAIIDIIVISLIINKQLFIIQNDIYLWYNNK